MIVNPLSVASPVLKTVKSSLELSPLFTFPKFTVPLFANVDPLRNDDSGAMAVAVRIMSVWALGPGHYWGKCIVATFDPRLVADRVTSNVVMPPAATGLTAAVVTLNSAAFGPMIVAQAPS